MKIVVLPAAISGVAEAASGELVIPNVISNTGNFSRSFAVAGAAPGTYSLRINDRIGRSVYSSTSYDNSWNGSQVAEGLYIYHLEDLKTGESYRGQLAVLK